MSGGERGRADDRPVRIGVQLQPQHATYDEIRRAVDAAEAAGVDVIFNWDHFFPLYGDPDGAHFECWTMLGAWAEQTERAEIGALVTCVGYRNPDLLADMARTVDHISGGRLVLGIGAGWFERDYDEYGYPFGTAGSRLTTLADALVRIEARWSALNPAPTRRIPVMVGGGGERKTLRLTARHADIWHGFGDADVIARKHRVLDEWCDAEEREPSAIERSAGVEGEPDDVGERLRALGTRLFTIGLGGPDYDLSRVSRWVAWRDRVNGG
ncbi:LLM class F420-dependent oxidoreductase [Aquipuribacter nitratireducens]|uniref:LLM class F420-dependent oxidoreductase n=1 Tax=Aquipuribacter nitratireducens TaxID=650104 RepID=A0ABW0GJV4_9MICO